MLRLAHIWITRLTCYPSLSPSPGPLTSDSNCVINLHLSTYAHQKGEMQRFIDFSSVYESFVIYNICSKPLEYYLFKEENNLSFYSTHFIQHLLWHRHRGPANRYQFMVSKAGYTCQGIARYKHTYCMLSYGVILRSLALQLLLLSTVEKLHESTGAVVAATTQSIHPFIHSFDHAKTFKHWCQVLCKARKVQLISVCVLVYTFLFFVSLKPTIFDRSVSFG